METTSCDWFIGTSRGNVRMKPKRGKRSIEAFATEFVNEVTTARFDLMSDPGEAKVTQSVGPHQWLHAPKRAQEPTPESKLRAEIRQKLEGKRFKKWALRLRKAWDKPEEAKGVLEAVFSPKRLSRRNVSRGESGARSPFQIRSGRGVRFEPRDDLDRIAYAILQASERGLLRICRGHKQGWDCPTPYLVADEGRRVYCYMRCGDEAKLRAKRKWWGRKGRLWRKVRKTGSPKRRQRAA